MAQRVRLGGGIRLTRPHLSGVIAMVAAIAISAWLLVDHRGYSSASVGANLPSTAIESAAGSRFAPVLLQANELATQARSLDEPAYWAGPIAGRQYELSRDDDRTVFVRYLANGAAAGDPAGALTVATIPFTNAYPETAARANGPDAVSRRLPDGGLAWYGRARPTTVYVAHPSVEYVVQVSDPTPGEAIQLAFSGRIRALG